MVCSQDSEAGAQTWSNELNDVRPGNLTRLTVFKSTSQQQQGALLGKARISLVNDSIASLNSSIGAWMGLVLPLVL